MKKILLTSAISLTLLIVSIIKSDFFASFGLNIFHFALIPFLTGMILVLVQDKVKSYQFIPELFLGTIIVSLGFSILIQLIEGGYESESFITPFLTITSISLLGGLIGLLIRGTRLVLDKKNAKF
jgi:hypothetical protein